MATISFFRSISKSVYAILALSASIVTAQNTLTLSIDEAKYIIKKDIYGALMEDWGRDIYDGIYVGTSSSVPNTNGMRNDIIEGLKEMKVGVLQFPGGCNAEEYRWRDGIGNKASRPGGEMENGMGTDEYFQLCEMVDCEPFIQLNCKESNPQEQAAWLNYINENHPNKLKYVGIGNEPWGGCWVQFDQGGVDRYLNEWYDPFNAAIPSAFDGKIIRIAAAGYTDERSGNFDWTETVVRREVGKAEGLSWHFYTTLSWTEGQKGNSTGFNENEYYAILDRAFAMENQAKKVMDIMDRHDPDYTMGLQPDEWGAWYNQIQGMGLSFQQISIRDAQLTAQHLNFFNNNCRRVWMSQSAQPVNAIHALFLTDRRSTDMVKTPSFYVYKLFVPHQNALMVPAELRCGKVRNLNALTASASIDDSDKVHISISNIHATEDQSLTITLETEKFEEYTVSGQIVNGPSFNSYNDFNADEEVNMQTFPSSNYSSEGKTINVTLPAHSVIMLEVVPLSTKTVNRKSGQFQKECSLRALPGNRIMVNHGFTSPTPVTVALYSIDGKAVVPPFHAVAEPGANTLVWEPNMQNIGANAYIVKVMVGNVVKSQRTLFLSRK